MQNLDGRRGSDLVSRCPDLPGSERLYVLGSGRLDLPGSGRLDLWLTTQDDCCLNPKHAGSLDMILRECLLMMASSWSWVA